MNPLDEAAERIVTPEDAARHLDMRAKEFRDKPRGGNMVDALQATLLECMAIEIRKRALPTAGDREALAKLICCPDGCEGARGCDWTEPDCVKRAAAILTWMHASGFRRDGVRDK